MKFAGSGPACGKRSEHASALLVLSPMSPLSSPQRVVDLKALT